MTPIKRCYFYAVVIVILNACGSKKTLTETSHLPEWAKIAPQSETFYYGVGKARRIGYPDRYIKEAEKNALQDLSQQIAVSIESSSLLYQFEFNNNKEDVYINRLKLNTTNNFQDYTVKDQFQDDNFYWTLIALSKAEYLRLKQQRKSESLNKAHLELEKAMVLFKKHELYKSLIKYVKTLEILKPYWGESTLYTTPNNAYDIAIIAKEKINEILNALTLEQTNNTIRVHRNTTINNVDELGILYYKNRPITGFPLDCDITELQNQSEIIWTKTQGRIYSAPFYVRSIEDKEVITIIFEPTKIVNTLTKDLALRKILKQELKPKQFFDITLQIIAPRLKLNLTVNGNKVLKSLIKNLITDFYSEYNIKVGKQDYSHEVNINIKNISSNTYEISTRFNSLNKNNLYFKNRKITIDDMLYKQPQEITTNLFLSIERQELSNTLKTLFKK